MSEYDDIINDPNYTYGFDNRSKTNPTDGDLPPSAIALNTPRGQGRSGEQQLREVTPDQKKILRKLYTQTKYADPREINIAVHHLEHAIETSDPSKPLPVPLQATLNAINELGIQDYDASTTMDMPEFLSTVPSGKDKCNAFVAWQYSKAGAKMGDGGFPVNTTWTRKHYAEPSYDWASSGGQKGAFSEVVGTNPGGVRPWLEPGDIVAIGVKDPKTGKPGGHTAMYVGGNLIISAASPLPGDKYGMVKVAPYDKMRDGPHKNGTLRVYRYSK